MDFPALLESFTAAVESGDGQRLAVLFTPDGTYNDGFYGPSTGRDAIAAMLEDHFHAHARDFRWQMHNPLCDGATGYANWDFSYTSKLPGAEGRRVIFEGMSRFDLDADGLIRQYTEIFDIGIPMAQLGFPAERIARSLEKAAGKVRAQHAGGVHFAKQVN